MSASCAVAATRTLRFATGTTLAVIFAFGLDYALASFTPVFTAVFLGASAPRPTLRQMGGILLASLLGLGVGAASSI